MVSASVDDDGAGADGEVSEAWEPLSAPDFWVVGFVATFQTVSLLVCVHLIRWRIWPPYVIKNVGIVIISVNCALFSWGWGGVADGDGT